VRIAVLSDTHNRLPRSVCDRIRDADEIWHLGDVCVPSTLIALQHVAVLRIVRGNCDDEKSWPLTLDFELEGTRFHLEHIPSKKPPACDVFLHGHTHVPRDETIGKVRFLNPGCITRPRGFGHTFAWLMVKPGDPLRWKLMDV
jgi:uncharacterized protein